MGQGDVGYPATADIGMQDFDATGRKFIRQNGASIIHFAAICVVLEPGLPRHPLRVQGIAFGKQRSDWQH